MLTLGVVSRFPDHLKHFAPAYYEVKGVTGVWHQPPSGAIPMVSIFGDNQVSRQHPAWVQVGPGGERAQRESRYFDWDALCPSWPEVFEGGLAWVDRAVRESGQPLVRLDDVTYAREGFCQCRLCEEAGQQRGLSREQYRMERIVQFIQEAYKITPHLQMTLFPDPFPGHLERRFGIDLNRLATYIEAFIVPIYDLHYATTYWLEVLAEAFLERLQRPYFIELYGLLVPEEALLHAAQVAQAYSNGVIVAYDNQLEKLLRIQERLGSAS